MRKSNLSTKLMGYYRRLPKSAMFLVTALLAIGLSLILLSVDSYLNDRAVRVSTKDNSYNNLDLSQAKHSSYINEPVKYIKELAATDNVKHYIVGFGVPKDGLTEYGLMTTPDSKAPNSGWPVIILCHGYANPQTYSTISGYLADMEFFSQHGFAVVKPDFRGQGLSLPDGSADGAFYSMSYNTDVMSLIAAIKNTTYFNKSRINMWGHSMGAYIALRAAVLSHDIKNLVLVSGPVASFPDMYADYTASSDKFNSTAAEIETEAFNQYGMPTSNPDFWNKASPINYLAGTNTYIQIHVGNKDEIVPPSFSSDLNDALNKLHKPHEYFVYDGGNHGLVAERPIIWQRSLDIFQK